MSGGKGTVDFLLCKYGMLQKLFGLVDAATMSSHCKDVIKKSFQNWESYVEYHKPEEDEADLSWQAAIPDEARLLMNFIEGLVYDTKYDSKAGSDKHSHVFFCLLETVVKSQKTNVYWTGEKLLHRWSFPSRLRRPR